MRKIRSLTIGRVAAIVLVGSMTVCASGALAAGDAAAGAKSVKLCMMCHVMTKGGISTIGPNLYGVVGRKAGTLAGYSYSPAMKGSGLTWDEATLTKYLMAPSSVVPGTKMIFNGYKQEEAESVAAYLATLKDTPAAAATPPAPVVTAAPATTKVAPKAVVKSHGKTKAHPKKTTHAKAKPHAKAKTPPAN